LNEIDLITALGRLLHDGPLRDAFAQQPLRVVEQLGVRAADRPALIAISFADLEYQAKILLRKRFDLVKRFVPSTIAKLGEQGWPHFFAYARIYWPEGPDKELSDAAEFCRYCTRKNVISISRIELNRLNFALDKRRFQVHLVCDLPARNCSRWKLQIFMRRSSKRWSEALLFLGL
jgi:hypothetical protein